VRFLLQLGPSQGEPGARISISAPPKLTRLRRPRLGVIGSDVRPDGHGLGAGPRRRHVG
jgi:hypothetical protein